MESKMVSRISKNDVFVRCHFEEFIKKYPRQRIVICEGEIFTGKDPVREARAKYPRSIPLSLPVPAPEEFTHIL